MSASHFRDWITTGSEAFDTLLGGGLSRSAITDVFGAAGTGKTQFAFQNSVFVSAKSLADNSKGSSVLFVDCANSFRPERIAEIAEARNMSSARILENILAIEVRSIADQRRASERILDDNSLSNCRLLIIDDITVNFVSELSKEEELIERQSLLSLYARHLGYVALKKQLSVLLTNSIRFREGVGESETTGDVLSQFTLVQLHFRKDSRGRRSATLEQPDRSGRNQISFTVEKRGIV